MFDRVIGIFAILSCCLLPACSSEAQVDSQRVPAEGLAQSLPPAPEKSSRLSKDSPPVLKALNDLRSEPAVKDVLFDNNGTVQWHIGVLNDGSSRVGYASYVCEVIIAAGAGTPETIVRIVDIAKVNNGISFQEANLGAVNCETRELFQAPKLNP